MKISKLLFFHFLIVDLIVVLFSFFIVNNFLKYEFMENFNTASNTIRYTLSFHIRELLYLKNYNAIKKFVKNYNSLLIGNIVVLDKHKKIIAFKRKVDINKIKNLQEFRFLNVVFGYLYIGPNKKYIECINRKVFVESLILSSLIFIFLFITSYLFFKTTLQRDISKLTTILRNNNLNDNLSFFIKEINFIYREILKRDNELNKINEHLNELVAEKTKELEKLNKELHKRVEEEIAKNREKDKQLMMQFKFAQQGEMLSMIAHQWKQPLNIIGIYMADMKVKLMLNTEFNLNEYLDKISKQIHYMSKIINSFSNFYKPSTGLVEIDTTELINEIENLLEALFQTRNVFFNKNVENVKFIGYKNELIDVLVNIIKNALDAFKDNNKKEGEINLKLYKKMDKIVIEIEDNAGGIDKSIIDKIFDPYFSTKGKNGTGLGLYMSKVIIEKHFQGEIFVESKNQKTKFTIIIPEKLEVDKISNGGGREITF